MNTETMSYEQQAIDFLESTNSKLEVVFKKHGKHFDNDTENRDIYSVTISRGARSFTFDFGQSIANSIKYEWFNETILCNMKVQGANRKFVGDRSNLKPIKNSSIVPTAYDILACLTKYDVGSFEDFCSEFGYDTDSRQAEKIYKGVLNEWQNVAMLWNDEEIAQLQEIQ